MSSILLPMEGRMEIEASESGRMMSLLGMRGTIFLYTCTVRGGPVPVSISISINVNQQYP